MRHGRAGNHLSRTTAHRDALIRNLAAALIEHERIRTTLPKARNLRPFIEKLVTLSKDGSLHRRRLVVSRLHDKTAAKKLFDVIGPRFKSRPGGYTRILKLAKRRLGDGGEQAIIEFVERTPKGEGQPEAKAAEVAQPKAKKPAKKASAGA
ncbi:MAG: 50S ribosomal protein L17 [Planctomycetes bacterium]|nr:50S ribosomal protein L17 [Planctomycetota bacterium]